MQAIIDFLSGIGNAITSLFTFVIDFIGDLVYLVKLTSKFLLEIPNYFSWLPGPVLAILLVIFSVVVLYKILGREG